MPSAASARKAGVVKSERTSFSGDDRRPGAVDDPVQVSARAQRLLDLLAVADRRPLEDAAVLAVEAAHDPHPEALARRSGRAVLGADLLQQPLLVADADTDVLALELEDQLLGLARQPQLDGAGDHLRQARVGLQPRHGQRIGQRRLDAGDELGDGELRDAALAERGQHVRDVLHERSVRADDEHAAAGVPFTLGVDEPRRAMEADRRLAGAGTALDHERPVRLAGDQPVLVGLDRRDDVAHVGVAAAVELLEEEVADAGAVERRAVERLVGDVEQLAALRAEAAAQRDALRILRGGGVERAEPRAPAS